MSARPVLLAGAGGPVGRAIAAAFRLGGAEVVLTSRSSRPGMLALDTDDPGSVRDLLTEVRPSTVVFLARPADPSPAELDGVMAAAARFMAECERVGVGRVLLASSAAVYGTDARTPRRETDPAPAPSPYAQLKLRAERGFAEAAGDRVAFLSLRIFNIYGPGMASSLVNRLALGEGPVVEDTDVFVRDYIHVDDVAHAFLAAAATRTAGIVNIGTGRAISNRALLAMAPGAPFQVHPEPSRWSYSVADVSRAAGDLEFTARITLEAAIADPARHLRGVHA